MHLTFIIIDDKSISKQYISDVYFDNQEYGYFKQCYQCGYIGYPWYILNILWILVSIDDQLQFWGCVLCNVCDSSVEF